MSESGEEELSFRDNSLFDPIHIYPFIDLFIYHCVYSVCAGTYLCLGRRFRLPLGQSLRDADDAVSLGRIERRLVNRPVTGAGWGITKAQEPVPEAATGHTGQTGPTLATHWPQATTRHNCQTRKKKSSAEQSIDRLDTTAAATTLPTPPTSAHTPRHQTIDDRPLYKPPRLSG